MAARELDEQASDAPVNDDSKAESKDGVQEVADSTYSASTDAVLVDPDGEEPVLRASRLRFPPHSGLLGHSVHSSWPADDLSGRLAWDRSMT